ncbi:unnamed protein product [Rotaria sp. Silwood1]|nr:unnamed protein product [Rotaria sp. Silwood1]CAF1055466.1 unnamed protein product [Rotaria sp. Silwood1]
MSSSSSSHISTMSSSSRITSLNCHSASAPANSSQSSISIITRDSSNAANSSSRMQHLSNASSVYDYPQMNSSPINLRKYSRSPTEHREAEAVRTATIIDESKKVPEDNVYCSCDEGY